MVVLTKEQCLQFLANETINPLTGREIEIGKTTHKQLKKLCNDTEKSFSKSPSFKNDYEIPPMGPILYWEISDSDRFTNRRTYIKLLKHVQKRLNLIESRNQKESKLEFKEFNDILKEILDNDIIHEKNKIIDSLKDTITFLKELEKTKEFINDIPKEKTINGFKIYKNRIEMRETIDYIFKRYNTLKKYIDKGLKNNDASLSIGKSDIKEIIDGKKYIDYLIKHNIFAYDDIYGENKVFENEYIFNTLEENYKIYRIMHKKQYDLTPSPQ